MRNFCFTIILICFSNCVCVCVFLLFLGSCLVKHLVCLVIDEAHRATGNYSYCVAVRALMDTPVQLRILALTATPGSKQQTIQHVIDNLQISTLEYRNETDHDVLPFVHERKIELIQVSMGDKAVEIHNLLLEVGRPFLSHLNAFGVLPKRDIQTLSPCDLLNSRDMFRQRPPVNVPPSRLGEMEGYYAALITLFHIRKLLSTHGIKPAFKMLEEKLKKGVICTTPGQKRSSFESKTSDESNCFPWGSQPKISKNAGSAH